ncbi:MAG TPA: LytTR family transcriptional regulator DNA-binding domain-containing protein [Chitinophagaceae bacterium]|nr:LytTR family transcriptional regulator DNA-binding domain-containing protein [Chitinophagaceae bacterium]
MTLQCLLLKTNQETDSQLSGFIQKTGSLSLAATTSSVNETIQQLGSNMPDIVFLPAQHYQQVKNDLPETEKAPVFICTSANKESQGTEQGYTQLCINSDPLSYTLFLDAVNRAIIKILGARAANNHKDENYFFIKSDYRILKVNYADIIFCEGLKDYTQVYTSKKAKPIITLQNLKTFSERLPAKRFIRIHRSYIVSLNHIDSITKKEVEIAEKMLPIGNSYRNNLLEIVKVNS